MESKVTPEQAEELIGLAEEASEIIHIICKILRFGWFSYHPNDLTHKLNRSHLETEMGDFLARYEILLELGAINKENVDASIDSKISHLREHRKM